MDFESGASTIGLWINVDHVATLRNARGGDHPDPVHAARIVEAAGADGITAHLREDRRHIRDGDVARLQSEIKLPLNLEIAATEEMLAIALEYRPPMVCLVPERREELTTEGGLDAAGAGSGLADTVRALVDHGIRVSIFVDPEFRQVEAAAALGAPAVELHTGAFCDAWPSRSADAELRRLQMAATRARALGLQCAAGHGLTPANVGGVAAIPEVEEMSIGHFLIGEAIFVGLETTIRQMRKTIDAARPAKGA